MKHFFEALASGGKHNDLPEEFDYFGKLIGSWKIDYVDNRDLSVMKGEWHFSWILGGMAVQDVIVLPGFEYGTTLRVYNPGTHAWDIVLTNVEDERRKWVFAEIQDNYFHWQDVMADEDGRWQVYFDLYAERI